MSNSMLPDSDEALLRASAAVCDTGYAWVAAAISSGLAEYTPEDIQELAQGVAATLQRPSQGSEFLNKTREEFRSRLDRLVSASVHIHEETHFYQLISTPYGRLASEIERYWVADLVQITKSLADSDVINPGSLPIRSWVERNLSPSSPNYILATFAELAYTGTHAVKSCFSGAPFVGFLGHKVSDLTIGDALNSWPDFLCAQDRAEDAIETPDLRIQQTSHPSALTTHLGEELSAVPALNGMKVTPRAIFEGAAQEIQLDWVRMQLDDSESLPGILRLLNPGFMNETYLTTRHLMAKMLPDVDWPARRSLLLTLSDLALWGPTHRDYLGGHDYDLPWEDLHPGYRFVRALDVVAEKRRYLSKADLLKPSAITELVCGELRWMEPLQMAENYLQAGGVDNAASRIAADALRDYRIRAARARIAEPAVFIDATNEQVIHEQFSLILPFIVERGRLRMQDSRERYELLFLSTLAHLASGVFDGNPSRLFNEPSNLRDIVYESVFGVFFGDKAMEFSRMLTDTNTRLTSQLAFESTAEPGQLDELIQRLNREGLKEYSRVVREARLHGKDAAIDWFSRQPAIVEAVLNLREPGPDGSFTIYWPALFGVLRQAIACSNIDSLKELFEDCGYHYFNRDIENLRRWHPTLGPASSEQVKDGQQSNENR
jgi:hypothetical protein